MRIDYIKRKDIDTVKWNDLISSAPEGLIYSRVDYLDLLSSSWDALVVNDYEFVMPLPFRSKFGIRYLYQPPFIQQSGIIGNADKAQRSELLNKAISHFRYARMNLNFADELPGTSPCNNFILDLSRTYDAIAAGFNYYLRRRTRDEGNAELRYVSSTSFERAINDYKGSYGHRFPHVDERSYGGLMTFARSNPENVLVREVWRLDQLLSSILCLKDSKRIYLLISINTEDGQKLEANRYLMDQLIREFAGQKLILDFEGSDLPGVAAYYQGFGAVNQPYYSVHWNRLPWPIRLIKK